MSLFLFCLVQILIITSQNFEGFILPPFGYTVATEKPTKYLTALPSLLIFAPLTAFRILQLHYMKFRHGGYLYILEIIVLLEYMHLCLSNKHGKSCYIFKYRHSTPPFSLFSPPSTSSLYIFSPSLFSLIFLFSDSFLLATHCAFSLDLPPVYLLPFQLSLI